MAEKDARIKKLEKYIPLKASEVGALSITYNQKRCCYGCADAEGV
jgi:hypothetical protein